MAEELAAREHFSGEYESELGRPGERRRCRWTWIVVRRYVCREVTRTIVIGL
jgi:hypothetical protein